MQATYRRCCGIDVHKNSVTVCVLAPVGQTDGAIQKRKFRTFTQDLKQLRAWLQHCCVTEIAMESTGQYWRPLWNLLEGQFAKLLLVNPQHIKGLNGYKTDPKDAQWIADLLEGGKLKGSWVPPRPIRELRDLTRQRVHVLEDLNRAKNRVEQLCQTGNIKVSSVATDLFGVSGRQMLQDLVKGERDAGGMAEGAKGRLRIKKRELTLALEGTLTVEQRWLLEEELGQVDWLEQQTQRLEQEIERRVEDFQEPIQRLLTIPGIDRKTAWAIVAEVGVEMSVFGDGPHLASWAGLCPGNRESGGKRMSGRTRKSNRYIKRTLCQAAWAASHTKGTYLSAFYRRMCVRKGAPKAILALAHHLMIVIYQILSRGEAYVELGGDYYDRRRQPQVVARLVKRLQSLGYMVSLQAVVERGGAESPQSEVAAAGTGQKADQGTAIEKRDRGRPRGRAESPRSEREVAAAVTGRSAEQGTAIQKRRRGRPCKCVERGIICKHRSREANSPLQELLGAS